MKSSFRKSIYWQATLWLGVFLTLAGFSSGFISGQWSSPVVLALCLVGVLILFAGFIVQAAQPQFWQQRSTQTGANALVSVFALLLILGVFNLAATQKPLRFDFTENQRYSLSEQSKQVVATLNKPAKLWIFDE